MGRGQARAAWSITPDKFFTAAEIEQLYSYLLSHSKSRRGKVNLFIIEMLLNAGLRATELCELRVEQTPVVLEENAIWVKGKGGKTRWITIVPEMSEKIRTFVREVRPGLLPTRARRSDYTKPLLITEYGGPFNRRSLYKRVRALGQRARLLKRVGREGFAVLVSFWASRTTILIYSFGIWVCGGFGGFCCVLTIPISSRAAVFSALHIRLIFRSKTAV